NKWSDFNPALPDVEIATFIPGTKHGTREVFEEKVLAIGCEKTGAMKAMMDAGMDKHQAKDACIDVRADGKSVDIDGDYTETLARIDSNANGIGVFGLAFYENNTDKLKVATMSGVAPSTETIASGEYPVSRPLFFYVKKAHIGVIPGLKEYAQFFVADEIAGPKGPLAQYGLVADPELAKTQAAVANEETMK
ncbi:MAG: substrate-binding domain-containing protein, partial [Hyphomicrobiales bacterium]|nr:substrate-binding domain-containing protein [Hyphomicrobiales bacterium]